MPRLTKRAVDALRPDPDGRDVFLWDDAVPGFGVRVRASGRRTYVLQYRDAGGRTRRIVVGEHGSQTPDEARSVAVGLRADAVAARRDSSAPDPAARRALARRTAKAVHDSPTVAELADTYLDECDAKLKPTTARQYRYLLGETPVKIGRKKGTTRLGSLRAALGAEKVTDVVPAVVAALHLSARATPYAANRQLALLSSFFAFAERQGVRPRGTNPCVDVAPFREHKRERYLTDAEFAAIGSAIRRAEREGLPQPTTLRTTQRRRATPETSKHRTKKTAPDGARELRPFSPVAIAALRFLILSGWREQEAVTLRWDAVDLERARATLADTKTGRSVRVIGAPVLEIIDTMRAFQAKGNPYVFPGTKPGRPRADIGRVWECVRHAAGLTDVRLHDLRHAFASVGLSSRQVELVMIGALLGHRNLSTTLGYTHLLPDDRQRAADTIAGHLAAAMAGKGSGPNSTAADDGS